MNFKSRLRSRLLARPDYKKIRKDYEAVIFAIIYSFLTDELMTKKEALEEMRIGITSAFIAAYATGVKDGGAGGVNKAWIKKRITKELAFIILLFNELEVLKQSGVMSAAATATARATGYTASLDGIYSVGKVTGAEDLLLTFLGKHGQPPEYPCKECLYYYEKTYPASFWIENDLVPYPGNVNFTCECWGCRHALFTQDGQLFTY